LKFAADSLPSTYPAAEFGRATAWAARTLLAKVYKTLKDFEAARPLLVQIEASHHNLMSNFSDVFTVEVGNVETIFAVRFNGEGGVGSSFSNSFAPLNSMDRVVNMGTSRGLNTPTWDLYDSYAEYDTLRRDASMGLWKGLNDSEEDRIRQRLYPKKFISPVISENQSSQDFPILRYADVLLMLAECINELDGPTSQVLTLINRVKNRAGIATEHNVSTDSRLEARLLIENERRWELAFENHRWFDLVRTDRAIEIIEKQIFF